MDLAGALVALEGTAEGRRLAMALALIAAVAHAVFGALQKGRHDPWLTRGAIDASYCVLAMPVALFLVPWPEGRVWALLVGAMAIQLGYKVAQATSYSRGSFTVVYPIVRGTGPLVTVTAATIVFGESYSSAQWTGVLMLSGGIFGLAAFNVISAGIDRRQLVNAVGFAFLTRGFVALYTTYNAYGIRATPNPFTFLAWFFFLDGMIFPWIAFWRWAQMPAPPEPGPLLARGVVGALVAFVSFGSIMLATRLDKVGEAAVLRETSVVFAAVIGWFFLGDKVGTYRALLVVAIAAGAVVVEFG